MKKLIVLLFVLASFVGYSQHIQDITLADDVSMATDGSFVKYVPENYSWSITVDWASVTGTLDGIVKIQVSDDGVHYSNYADLDSVTIDEASGHAIFEDSYFAHKFYKVVFTKNSITAGTLNALLILKPRE